MALCTKHITLKSILYLTGSQWKVLRAAVLLSYFVRASTTLLVQFWIFLSLSKDDLRIPVRTQLFALHGLHFQIKQSTVYKMKSVFSVIHHVVYYCCTFHNRLKERCISCFVMNIWSYLCSFLAATVYEPSIPNAHMGHVTPVKYPYSVNTVISDCIVSQITSDYLSPIWFVAFMTCIPFF